MKIEDEIKQFKFKSPHQKAVINLIFTANWLFSKQQEFFKPFGITAQQFNILRILKGQHPNGISASEIKIRMLDKNSDVSRLLDRLRSKKLIQKKVKSSDKRATDVFITSSGMELLSRIGKYQKKLDAVLSLSEEQALRLSDLLDKCRE